MDGFGSRTGSCWLLASTLPRAEERARENLNRQGFGTYLPHLSRWCVHARRRALVKRPLFPGYVFVDIAQANCRWRSILGTYGVRDLARVGGMPTKVPASIIASLRDREIAGAFDETLRATRLAAGALVRVVGGPFHDVVGRMVSMSDQERVAVLLTILGHETLATFPARDLVPA